MKNKVLYIIGLAIIIYLLAMLILMQSEFAHDYITNLLCGVGGVALVCALGRYIMVWVTKRRKKGPVFFINGNNDEIFILSVRRLLGKVGCICYPTNDLILQTDIEKTLSNQIRQSRLVVVLLSEDSANNAYINYTLKLTKKVTSGPLLFFTKGGDFSIPSTLRKLIPIQLDGHSSADMFMAEVILANLPKS